MVEAPGLPARVLLVEDDASVAKMLQFSLRGAGFLVETASTGGEALRILDASGADLVVLDLGLPDDRAGEVLDRLRTARGRSQTEWVVITAQDPDDVLRRYGMLGERFVSKPFDPWALVNLLHRLLADR